MNKQSKLDEAQDHLVQSYRLLAPMTRVKSAWMADIPKKKRMSQEDIMNNIALDLVEIMREIKDA